MQTGGAAAQSEGPHNAGEDAAQRAQRLRDELDVVRLFADVPEAPFSIQRIAQTGVAQGTPVGTWFGPTPISQVLSQLLARSLETPPPVPASSSPAAAGDAPATPPETADAAPSSPSADAPDAAADDAAAEATADSFAAGPHHGLCIHVAMDGSLYRNLVREAAAQPDGTWRPVLVLLPLRLGLQTLNADYVPCLTALFQLRQSVGVVGGAPRRSFYFVGCQPDAATGPQLLYLDPHEVQPALSLPLTAEQLRSCHCTHVPRTMPVAQIDPSLALGFLCATAAEFDELCTGCADIFARTLPAFSIGDAPPMCDDLSAGDVEAAGNEEEEDLVVV